MPGISRAQITMKSGQRVLQLATAAAINPAHFALARRSILDDLTRVIESCREARGMYLNYPRLRRHLLATADVLEGIATELEGIEPSQPHARAVLANIGTQLRTLDFSPTTDELPTRARPQAQSLDLTTSPDAAAELLRALTDPSDSLD